MKMYYSLYKMHKKQALTTVFAHFYPIDGDYDEPFKLVAAQTIDGLEHFATALNRGIPESACL